MFREYVNLIDPIPEEYTNTLIRINDEPDYSLTCLGVALYKHRIENYQGITGVYRSRETKQQCLEHFVNCIGEDREYPVFCYYKYNQSNFDEDFVTEHLDEFKNKKSIEMFVKEKMGYECLILYHETKNIVGIFVNSSDMRLYHLLLSFQTIYYPSIFAKYPPQEEDYNLFKALSNKEPEQFYNRIKEAVEKYIVEFRRIQMSNFLKQIHASRIRTAETNVNNQRSRIRSYEESIAAEILKLRQYIVEYEGLKATETYDKPEEDLVEHLALCKEVHNIKFRNNALTFNVATYLNNYNVDAWEMFKERGFIYDGDYNTDLHGVFEDRNNRKVLLDSIFSDDPKLMIKICGNYRLSLLDNRVYCDSDYDYPNYDPIFENYMPNPHIKLFECLGGYKDKVMEALMDRNYVSAINLCIASAGSVNLDETTMTFRPFLGWLLTSTKKVLATKDGQEFTPEEALVWLLDKELKNETD